MKRNIIEDKKFGVIVSLFTVIIYYIIKYYKYSNINKSSIAFSKTWLEMSLLFTFVAVTIIFVNLLIIVVFAIDEDLTINLNQNEKQKTKSGIIFGFLACMALLVIIILSYFNIFENVYILQFLSILFAFFAYFMDKQFRCKTEMLKFDLVIFFSLLFTLVLSLIFQYSDFLDFDNKTEFVNGFTAGATAFQVFIAGLFFNTEEYSKNRIFKLKTNKD